MKDTEVVLLGSTNNRKANSFPSMEEILFTPAMVWVTTTLKKMGYTNLLLEGCKAEEVPEDLSCVTLKDLEDWLQDKTEKTILVLGADAPLISSEEIKGGLEFHRKSGMEATLFSTDHKLATGAGWYKGSLFLKLVGKMTESFSLYQLAGELENYLVGVGRYYVPPTSLLPADSSINRGTLTQQARDQIIKKHRYNDVEIPLSDGIMISPQVTIGKGTTIFPGTLLLGETVIGEQATIGPNSRLEHTVVGDHTSLQQVYAEHAVVGEHCAIGPMSHLRPGTVLGNKVRIGNFVEVKNSTIGDGTAAAHLTYLGDSDVGTNCNISCGVITVNYDGKEKHRTTIGDDVFVGCNSNLIAPVTLEDRSFIGAGTTVTETVPSKALAIGRVRQEIKEDWVTRKRDFKK